eukprot:scaffold32684_cov69-Phaeocystis_antarctica.AAC.1
MQRVPVQHDPFLHSLHHRRLRFRRSAKRLAVRKPILGVRQAARHRVAATANVACCCCGRFAMVTVVVPSEKPPASEQLPGEVREVDDLGASADAAALPRSAAAVPQPAPKTRQ